MRVEINGVQYVPAASASGGVIGIAITTHNRPVELAKALQQHAKHLPLGAFVVVVDDGSEPAAVVPDWVTLIRHDEPRGIVASKNASIKALLDAGCTELFLFDDDAWPKADGWHKPYIESPEPHLAYQFLDLATATKLKDMAILHKDAEHVAYTGQRGVMLYYHRSVIEQIGGMDWVYGRGMYEHPDLALRIFNAGLTSWAFADVVGSEKLFHSMDEYEEGRRSVPRAEREALAVKNAKIYSARRDAKYTGYSPLDPPMNAVIAALLTDAIDHQRQKKMDANPDMLAAWAGSIKGARAFVLADHLQSAPSGAELVGVNPSGQNPYMARWLHAYQWLREHKEVDFVFCTDGTDVVMLREPWAEMQRGKLYVGSEAKTLSCEWMLGNHKSNHLQEFMKANRHKTLLNAGIVGGERSIVLRFVHEIIKDWYLGLSHRFWGMEKAEPEKFDMGMFNYVAYTCFGDQIVTGPQVHSVFKTDGFGREHAWWQHK